MLEKLSGSRYNWKMDSKKRDIRSSTAAGKRHLSLLPPFPDLRKPQDGSFPLLPDPRKPRDGCFLSLTDHWKPRDGCFLSLPDHRKPRDGCFPSLPGPRKRQNLRAQPSPVCHHPLYANTTGPCFRKINKRRFKHD